MGEMVQGYPVCSTWSSRCAGHGADGCKPEGMLPAAHYRERYEFAQELFQNLPTRLTKFRLFITCYDYGIDPGKDTNPFPCRKNGIG